MDQKEPSGLELHLGVPQGGTTHQGAPGPPGAPRWSVASRTACLLYKYPNIPETLGELTKINSSRRRVQNHQIMEGFTTSIGASPMMRE